VRTDSFTDNHLNVAFFFAPLVVLGPGRRIGLWLRGCSKHCSGCLAPELWSPEPYNWLSIEETFDEILRLSQGQQCCGLTVSGGEPFEQIKALNNLCHKLFPIMPDILIFSGRHREEWENTTDLTHKIACLIDGPFEESKPCPEAWRGSANQNMIIYSDFFRQDYENWRQLKKGSLQLAKPIGRVLGIPHAKTFT
jgi:anaerobic ribonucleoside-triphosphate reductase activating protein